MSVFPAPAGQRKMGILPQMCTSIPVRVRSRKAKCWNAGKCSLFSLFVKNAPQHIVRLKPTPFFQPSLGIQPICGILVPLFFPPCCSSACPLLYWRENKTVNWLKSFRVNYPNMFMPQLHTSAKVETDRKLEESQGCYCTTHWLARFCTTRIIRWHDSVCRFTYL